MNKLTNFNFEEFKYFNHQAKSNSSSVSTQLNSTQTTELVTTQLNLFKIISDISWGEGAEPKSVMSNSISPLSSDP